MKTVSEIRLGRGICGSFFNSFSPSQVVIKKPSNDNLFCSIISFLYKDQLFSDHFYISIENFGFNCDFAKENVPVIELCSIFIKKLASQEIRDKSSNAVKYCQE